MGVPDGVNVREIGVDDAEIARLHESGVPA